MVNRWEGSRTLDTGRCLLSRHHSGGRTPQLDFLCLVLLYFAPGRRSVNTSVNIRQTDFSIFWSGRASIRSWSSSSCSSSPVWSPGKDGLTSTLSPIEIPVKIQIKVLVWFRSWYLREILWYSQVFQSDRNGNKITWDDMNFRTLLHQQF